MIICHKLFRVALLLILGQYIRLILLQCFNNRGKWVVHTCVNLLFNIEDGKAWKKQKWITHLCRQIFLYHSFVARLFPFSIFEFCWLTNWMKRLAHTDIYTPKEIDLTSVGVCVGVCGCVWLCVCVGVGLCVCSIELQLQLNSRNFNFRFQISISRIRLKPNAWIFYFFISFAFMILILILILIVRFWDYREPTYLYLYLWSTDF